MPTPAEVIKVVSSLMNDTEQNTYTNAVVLPYLNMAMADLQEIFEQNNIPVTNEVSTVINMPAGEDTVRYRKYPSEDLEAELPTDLIEIVRLWESPENEDNWTPMARKEFLPHYLEGVLVNKFLVWTWLGNQIKLLPANTNIDLKLDYTKSIFNTIELPNINIDIPIRNIKSYLGYRTASLCAMYIGENETRAGALSGDAEVALNRSLGISNKGRQAINTRRRPFRAGWKRGAYF